MADATKERENVDAGSSKGGSNAGTTNGKTKPSPKKQRVTNYCCFPCSINSFPNVEVAAKHFESKPHNLQRLKNRIVVGVIFLQGGVPPLTPILKLFEPLPVMVVGCVMKNDSTKGFVLINQTKQSDKVISDFIRQNRHPKLLGHHKIKLYLHTTSNVMLEKQEQEVKKLKLPGVNVEEVNEKLKGLDGTISRQMEFLQSLVIVNKSHPKREEFCRSLEALLSSHLGCEVKSRLFGSSINGFGFPGCDMDVLLEIPDLAIKDVVQAEDEDMDRAIQKRKVQLTHNVLIKHAKDKFLGVVAIKTARVPIVKCFSVDVRVNCDLSFKNSMSVLNSIFIKELFEILPNHFHLLAVTLRYWAFVHDLAGNTGCKHNSTSLSNYALIMMVVFYLQSEGCVPAVRDLFPNENQVSCVIDGWQCGYTLAPLRAKHSDLKKACIKLTTDPLSNLLIGFFRFYLNFDYQKLVISPFAGVGLAKDDFKSLALTLEKVKESEIQPAVEDTKYETNQDFDSYYNVVKNGKHELLSVKSDMVVQDPFELNHCVTKAIGERGLKNWKLHCQESIKVLEQDKAKLVDIFTFKATLPPEKRRGAESLDGPKKRAGVEKKVKAVLVSDDSAQKEKDSDEPNNSKSTSKTTKTNESAETPKELAKKDHFSIHNLETKCVPDRFQWADGDSRIFIFTVSNSELTGADLLDAAVPVMEKVLKDILMFKTPQAQEGCNTNSSPGRLLRNALLINDSLDEEKLGPVVELVWDSGQAAVWELRATHAVWDARKASRKSIDSSDDPEIEVTRAIMEDDSKALKDAIDFKIGIHKIVDHNGVCCHYKWVKIGKQKVGQNLGVFFSGFIPKMVNRYIKN